MSDQTDLKGFMACPLVKSAHAALNMRAVLVVMLVLLSWTNFGIAQNACSDGCKQYMYGDRTGKTHVESATACRDSCRGNSSCSAWMYWDPDAPHGTLCEFVGASYWMDKESSSLNVTTGIVRLSEEVIDANAPEFWNTLLHANFDTSTAILVERGDMIALVVPERSDGLWSKQMRQFLEELISRRSFTVGEAYNLGLVGGGALSEKQWRLAMKSLVGNGLLYVSPAP